MHIKTYAILLDDKKIGSTKLENGDAFMGVVFGKIHFLGIESGYNFFKNYCEINQIEMDAYPEFELISTRTIPGLKVFNQSGIEIKGLATSISGMDSEEFEIAVEGIPYPFYEELFPHHVKAYGDRFTKI